MKPITVIAVTTQRLLEHVKAVEKTMECLPIPSDGMVVHPPECPVFQSKGQWGVWVSMNLPNLVNTDYAIVVQWDGYAVHRERWMDEFLEYDYIGAPWPPKLLWRRPWWRVGRWTKWAVGNGGFSLRSHRWMESQAKLDWSHPLATRAEDLYACRVKREFMDRRGCKVAPLEVAYDWSYEYPFKEASKERAFGFHGSQNIPVWDRFLTENPHLKKLH